jgi:hypothetical protein
VAGHELGTELALLLFIGRRQHDDVAVEADPCPLEGDDGQELQDAHRLHVERAPPVHEAAVDHAAERIDAPVPSVGGNDVDVAMEHEARPAAGPGHAGDQVAAARRGFRRLGGTPLALEQGGQERDAVRLVAGWIGGVDHQVLAQTGNGLVAEPRPVGVGERQARAGAIAASGPRPAVSSRPSATARSLVTRGTLFWPPSLPRERIHA